MDARNGSRGWFGVLLTVVTAGAWGDAPVTPNLSPEFPVPSTLPDTTRPAPRSYDCTQARGLGDCTQMPGPPPAVLGAPLPPPRIPPADAGDDVPTPAPMTPGVPKLP